MIHHSQMCSPNFKNTTKEAKVDTSRGLLVTSLNKTLFLLEARGIINDVLQLKNLSSRIQTALITMDRLIKASLSYDKMSTSLARSYCAHPEEHENYHHHPISSDEKDDYRHRERKKNSYYYTTADDFLPMSSDYACKQHPHLTIINSQSNNNHSNLRFRNAFSSAPSSTKYSSSSGSLSASSSDEDLPASHLLPLSKSSELQESSNQSILNSKNVSSSEDLSSQSVAKRKLTQVYSTNTAPKMLKKTPNKSLLRSSLSMRLDNAAQLLNARLLSHTFCTTTTATGMPNLNPLPRLRKNTNFRKQSHAGSSLKSKGAFDVRSSSALNFQNLNSASSDPKRIARKANLSTSALSLLSMEDGYNEEKGVCREQLDQPTLSSPQQQSSSSTSPAIQIVLPSNPTPSKTLVQNSTSSTISHIDRKKLEVIKHEVKIPRIITMQSEVVSSSLPENPPPPLQQPLPFPHPKDTKGNVGGVEQLCVINNNAKEYVAQKTSDYESNASQWSNDDQEKILHQSNNQPLSSEFLAFSQRKRVSFSSIEEDSKINNGVSSVEAVKIVKAPSSPTSATGKRTEEDDLIMFSAKDCCGLDKVYKFSLSEMEMHDENLNCIYEWGFPIFQYREAHEYGVLTRMVYRVFYEANLIQIFNIPLLPFFKFFQKIENGYNDVAYHNLLHATDVLHSVFYLTSHPLMKLIFKYSNKIQSDRLSLHTNNSDGVNKKKANPFSSSSKNTEKEDLEDEIVIAGKYLTPLELLAIYMAAAIHDHDHPGRTNAFLVSTQHPLAVLYNDRSVLENHHVASSWDTLTSSPEYNFLTGLDQAEFKLLRFLVIEAVLATDLKQHFDIITEFNAEVSSSDLLDMSCDRNRILIILMYIKLADIAGPTKPFHIHFEWTQKVVQEFYDQGEEEKRLGLEISPYMDRNNPQLCNLQESFIAHLVSPLCNSLNTAFLLPCEPFSPEENRDLKRHSEALQIVHLLHENLHTPILTNLIHNYSLWLKTKKESSQSSISSGKEVS